MAAKIFRINYKSDFILTMNSDAGWAIPFCIKFWTSVPSRAYFVGFDGTTYTHCAYDPSEPTKLVVQFDDHHLPIGDLNYQIAYHFTVADFPNDTEDEVINPAAITTEIDGDTYHVMLDFTGETAPEIEFNLPAYANEAERIQNELQRQQNEADRIAAELQREQATAAAVQGAENVNAQLRGTTLTVTNRQGVSTSVNTKGEQGEQGPVGPQGPQGQKGVSVTGLVKTGETDTDTLYNVTFSDGTTQAVAIPKGAKGDTGATGPTGPQGPQGQTGVSITDLVKTGETETDTLYNVTFSDGTTQSVTIPKGEKGDQGPVGPQGPQGPMGDVAVITPEQQAAFTMYSTTGQNTNGPMSQKAVTDALGNIKSSKYEQIPVSWVSGYYINASNNLVANSDFRAAQNVDISGYKKIIACVKIQASAAKYVILDENYTVLKAETKTMPQIDLANYPTAKYMSFTNQDYTHSGIIYGIKQEDTSIQDSFADYLEFGTELDNYVRSVGKETIILPKINTGVTISTINTTSSVFPSGKCTQYGVIPVGATKIYYTGRSYGTVAGVLFYDKYKNLISLGSGGSDTNVTDKEFTIPQGAVYYRCSSINNVLSYYFDNMPQVMLGGDSGSITTLQEMPISLTYGGYINKSNSVASTSECYYARDIDISEYSGKKLVIMCNASLSASRNILLDEDYNILLSYQGIRESVDLAMYPTAKYLSVTNNVSYGTIKYSGKIFVVNEAEETETEILNSYYEVYGSGSPAYAKMITDRYYIEPKADAVGYYISNKGIFVSRSGARYTSEYYLIPSVATKIYYTGESYGSAAGVLFYDKYKNIIKAVAVGSSSTPVTNAEVTIPSGAIYYRLSSMSAACSAHFDNPTIPVGGSSGGDNDLSNYLSHKKYVAIGDSFTDVIGSEVIEEGPLAGMSKVYPYIIANRNNMTVLNQGSSGSVLNWYIYTGKYNAIPEDVDYITIWYGINDQQHGISIGTVDDQPESVTSETSTSTCGGFNWFFKWLCTNRPYAKIGCIITDYSTEERRNAIIACCKKWGIAYLDLMGDPTIPMFPGGRNSNIAVSQEAINLKRQFFNLREGDMHPSNKCHEWQSTIIESFMRRI